MEVEREFYHSNGMLGLIPVVDEREAMSFHLGKLNADSRDFFNCDPSIGLGYPERPALQPIAVHTGTSDWYNGIEKGDENVELLDISSKRLPADLNFNGLDKTSYTNGGSYSANNNSNPNSNVIATNSLPASDCGSAESSDNGYSQCNESYNMRVDYGNPAPFVDNGSNFYNSNQTSFANGFHDHQHYEFASHLQINHHYSNQQNHLVHSHPTTPLHHYHSPRRQSQQPFQRNFAHRRRLNLTEKTSPNPTKQRKKRRTPKVHNQLSPQTHQMQSQVQQVQQPTKPQKSLKALKPLKTQKALKTLKTQQLQKSQKPLKVTKAQQKMILKRQKQRARAKALEEKLELKKRLAQKRKIGKPRKYDYVPPRPVKFRSHRLRLKVQSEMRAEGVVADLSDPEEENQKVNVRVKGEKKSSPKNQEVLPVEWDRPENLSFERNDVSEFEKTSLPEFFAGKYDRTHFHPEQYLQIRNIFLDEWESRKPQTIGFREMIRLHKGIGNVVSFSRVCKFLTAIGAINDTSQEDGVTLTESKETDDEGDQNCLPSSTLEEIATDEKVPEESKDSSSSPPSSSSLPPPPPPPPPPPSSSFIESESLIPNTNETKSSVQIDEKSSEESTTPPRPRRKGRKRKSYFLNEMSRLGIDPLSMGITIPDSDEEEDKDQDKGLDKDDKSEHGGEKTKRGRRQRRRTLNGDEDEDDNTTPPKAKQTSPAKDQTTRKKSSSE